MRLDEFWCVSISFPLFFEGFEDFAGFFGPSGPLVAVVPLAFVFPVFCGGFKGTPQPPYQPLSWSHVRYKSICKQKTQRDSLPVNDKGRIGPFLVLWVRSPSAPSALSFCATGHTKQIGIGFGWRTGISGILFWVERKRDLPCSQTFFK